MTKKELEEINKLRELSKKYKGCRCSQYCSVWNSEDRDCEIMGENHLSPSRCRWFLRQELRKEEEKPVGGIVHGKELCEQEEGV